MVVMFGGKSYWNWTFLIALQLMNFSVSTGPKYPPKKRENATNLQIPLCKFYINFSWHWPTHFAVPPPGKIKKRFCLWSTWLSCWCWSNNPVRAAKIEFEARERQINKVTRFNRIFSRFRCLKLRHDNSRLIQFSGSFRQLRRETLVSKFNSLFIREILVE